MQDGYTISEPIQKLGFAHGKRALASRAGRSRTEISVSCVREATGLRRRTAEMARKFKKFYFFNAVLFIFGIEQYRSGVNQFVCLGHRLSKPCESSFGIINLRSSELLSVLSAIGVSHIGRGRYISVLQQASRVSRITIT